HAISEQVRLDERERVAAAALAPRHAGLRVETGTKQVAFRNAHIGDEAVRGRVTAGDREVAGRLLLHVDVADDAVRRRSLLIVDLDTLEVVEVLEASLRPIDQRAVVGVAFADVELATDDVFARAGIAANVDSLDVGPLPLVDQQCDRNRVILEIAVALR